MLIREGVVPQLKTRRRRRIFLAVVLALCAFAIPTLTFAHPLGNFTVNRYSRLEPTADQIRLTYILDLAEIPTFQNKPALDTNSDGIISAAESDGWATTQIASITSNLQLSANGRSLALTARSHTLEFLAGQGGLDTTRLTINYEAPLPDDQIWQVDYRDNNFADRLGWQEVVVRAGEGSAIADSSVATEDISQELRVYPVDLVTSPLAINSATFTLTPGAGTTAPGGSVPATVAVLGRANDEFAQLITQTLATPQAIALALAFAFVLGASHAMTPGHGKTIVAAYLVGSRGTALHALFLGLTTTVTHTAGVFALGLVTLFLAEFILPEQLFLWLGTLSGLMVVLIGARLFQQRLYAFRHPAVSDNHDHSSLTAEDLGKGHSHNGTFHHHNPGALPDGERVTWRNLFALGVSGGLLPCPSALVVLLSAIALGRVGLGLLLIVAFSMGLAGVLTGIGILMVHAGRLLQRFPSVSQGPFLRLAPVLSAIFVTVAGVAITWQAVGQTKFAQAIAVAVMR